MRLRDFQEWSRVSEHPYFEKVWLADDPASEIVKMLDELVHPTLAVNPDMVNHPAHYTGHPTIEAIEVLEHVQDYRLGTAMKYLWRIAFGGKHDSVEDAKKAVWYINRWLEKQSDV